MYTRCVFLLCERKERDNKVQAIFLFLPFKFLTFHKLPCVTVTLQFLTFVNFINYHAWQTCKILTLQIFEDSNYNDLSHSPLPLLLILIPCRVVNYGFDFTITPIPLLKSKSFQKKCIISLISLISFLPPSAPLLPLLHHFAMFLLIDFWLLKILKRI